MVNHQLSYYFQVALVRFLQQYFKFFYIAIRWVDAVIIGNVVPIVAQGRRVKGKYPHGGYAQFLQVVQLSQQPLEVANTIAIAIVKGFNVQVMKP